MFTNYIYIGEDQYNQNIEVPEPIIDNQTFDERKNAYEAVNANGVKVSHQIGAPVVTQQLGWDNIKAEKWWEIGAFFRKNGDVFWCKFFDHSIGEWLIKRFRRQNPQCEVVISDELGCPISYRASFEIESVGD